MATNGNANAVPFIRNSNLFRKRIMDSLVCWYDPGKQQCTNESMAANPVLADLSGNGHDATCYNFAFAESSGCGKYAQTWKERSITNDYGDIYVNKSTLIYNPNSLSALNAGFPENEILQPSDVPIKISIKGLKEDGSSIFQINIEGNTSISFNKDGIHEIQIPSGYKNIFVKGVDNQVVIQQIPEYQGALVFDGVDDYCLVEGLPLLNKEDGYTVIAKRRWLESTKGRIKGLVSKSSNNVFVDGAFILEGVEGGGDSPFVRSFNKATYMNEYMQDEIVYMTSISYNGQKIEAGDSSDTDKLVIASLSIKREAYGKIALYSLLLFNRNLTTAEIEWVKKNMIEGGTEI